ncbi:Atrial natriuretic peptide receptor 1 isoform x2 [Plakobranchus ocellatus]|uniref:Atrial natriuretic peptide receptor 1 isoform x2 n=1 Tax=Plakobranchus ocellatus TaxID=259542 RepID=A0AAV3Z3Q2_9GAST|nr:Atrial natriuretic peptide receptor 1 isoform x2 [Plakobranchus ocellatus]
MCPCNRSCLRLRVLINFLLGWFMYIANPQQCDIRRSGPPSGQGAGGGDRTRDRRVPADLRADSLSTVPPTPPRFSQTQLLLVLIHWTFSRPMLSFSFLCPDLTGAPVHIDVHSPDLTGAPVHIDVHSPDIIGAPVHIDVHSPDLTGVPVHIDVHSPDPTGVPVHIDVHSPDLTGVPVHIGQIRWLGRE